MSHESASSTEAAFATPATTAGVLATYSVVGMTCAHCVASVTEELSELPAVTAIAVDLNEGGESTVTVTSSAPLSEDDVRAAITEAGYELAATRR